MKILIAPILAATISLAPAQTGHPPSAHHDETGIGWDALHKDLTPPQGAVSASLSFSLLNRTRAILTLQSIKPLCGCTSAQTRILPMELLPGASTTIDLTIHLTGKRGRLKKAVAVTTSAGTQELTFDVILPESVATGQMPTVRERMNRMAAASGDRQVVFQGDCRKCHYEPAIARNGADLYVAACAICHDTPRRAFMVPDLAGISASQRSNPDYWKQWIAHGKPTTLMPAFQRSQGGPLTESQIDELAKYLSRKTEMP